MKNKGKQDYTAEGEKRIHNEFSSFYSMRFKEEDMRGVNPFEIKKAIKEKTGCNPEAIAIEGRQAFTIRVRSEEQGRKFFKNQRNKRCAV